MKILNLIEKALEHEAAWDLFDTVVVNRLKESRDLCVIERDRLDQIKTIRPLEPHEEEDWACLVLDIASLNRVIEYYGGNLND